ncbi:proteasome complex subunit Rpn13 ubiquitin receptor-domain-containing protein [Annulohypoxylon maeteangense]|uniref:proteasome complex subunit Rpn13 ubiquitin receptor-domain-containing protein n=1 Tax=Annulohypoxylon maeteangense TaxID=1927788 RepID=UPI002008E293|nr:proteasome complex subunit Rpn13 ubiquitin receptor-domain-containing protein [Annulohypoxylon maeteangense]KAI0889965.1 proteasome complex subunit Rpn13 ubiquitin receptor-domain-containing protein [Annulohypoxylon maeteangense]
MSVIPIITFKAGICDIDHSERPYKIKASPRPGYIYLYSEDELLHFCWRERSAPADNPDLDLVMVPTDGHFVPYDPKAQPSRAIKPNGRVFVLKFLSSSQRHLFYLQSKPQGRTGNPRWFSPRDLKIGDIVDKLLQGEDVDVARELASINNSNNDDRHGDDDDEAMEDVEGSSDPRGGSGGAGAGATGGDVREEGEGAREGGADGARAAAGGASDAATAVRNFLNSLQGGGSGASQGDGKLYPLLSDLLTPPVTVPMARQAEEEQVDNLLSFLPPSVLILSQQANQGDSTAEPTAAAIQAAREAMSLGQKKALLEKVLRSPQFHQSLASLTMAIRDGGLPSIADALSIKVKNGGYLRGSQMPLGGGDAVEAFVEGVKKTVQEKQ